SNFFLRVPTEICGYLQTLPQYEASSTAPEFPASVLSVSSPAPIYRGGQSLLLLLAPAHAGNDPALPPKTAAHDSPVSRESPHPTTARISSTLPHTPDDANAAP